MSKGIRLSVLGAILILTIIIGMNVIPASSYAGNEPVSVWLTTSDGANNLSQKADLTFTNDTSGGSALIDVNEAVRYQTMDGFGASMTDASAYLIGTKMNATQRANVLNDLFNPTTGLGINFVRIPMGSSDFSATPSNAPFNYSYDDNNGQTDPNLTNFSINHDMTYIIPTLQQAVQINPAIKFIATPWSPPAWMKTNDSMFGNNAQGNGTLLANAYAPLSQYFVKFIQAYQSNGVPIYAVSPQNEPSAATTDYAGMVWDSAGEGSFIKNNLGPDLAAANLNTKILGYDNGWDKPFSNGLANDPAVRNYLGGLAFHCYSGDPAVMTYFKNQYNLDSYETECSTGPGGIAAGGAIRVGMQTSRNWGKAVELWNLALDTNGGPKMGSGCQGCTGVVTIDQATGNYTRTQNYYQLGHFSKFVKPGAIRVDSTDSLLTNSAFINPDNSRVLVVHNETGSTSTFKVRWNMTESISYTLPNDGIATFTWQGGTPGPTAAPTPTPTPAPVSLVMGINSGGGASGRFDADSYFTGGNLSGSSATIDTSAVTNPAPQQVYQTERWGPNTYTLPSLTPGQAYTVRLHFAELNWTAPGMRKFNVFINGTQVLTEFDIFAAAGGINRAIVKDFNTTANSSGQIIIQYANGSVDNAKSSGIEIYTVDLNATPTPTPTPTPIGAAIPGTIEAESYSAMNGIQTENTADTGGGLNVGFTDNGDWMDYIVNVQSAGIYNVGFRVASNSTTSQLQLKDSMGSVLTTVNVPNTGGWQTWSTVYANVNLTAGNQILRVYVSAGGFNLNWLNFTAGFVPTPTPTPTPIPIEAVIPGTIEAESYFAMNGIQTENTADTGGGLNVGFTDSGDWMDYRVNVQNAGTYTVGFRVASIFDTSQIQLKDGAGSVLTTFNVPNTSGWQTWTTAYANVNLTAGSQTLRVYISSGGFNLNWLNFTTSLPTSTPTPISAFNQIEAESYDSQFGIQTESSSEGGLNVGFIDNGDYIGFNSVDFGNGATSFDARVASNAGGGYIEVWLDNVLGTFVSTCAVPVTGGWQNWTTKTCNMNAITGVHNLYLKFAGGSGNLFNFNWFKFSAANPNPTPTPVPSSGGDVVGKIFAGYQGWFNAAGDGSPNGGWVHWSKNSSAPTANTNVNFELYPDLREYTNLYQTNLANLGNGEPAKLFSSYDQSTVNKHFEWMQTYNIDGAALQRFGADISNIPSNWKTNRDSVAVKVKNAAETYGRKFYVMYDITGMSESTWANAVKHDWITNIVNTMNLTSSSAYAQEGGKPVVCIWGIGFTDRPGTAAESADLISWFKNQGVYVIGGVPTSWRTGNNDSKSGFLDVYKSLDMISPWSVGRFGGLSGVDNYNTNQWQPDFTFTQQNGIAYQPVMWPGSAWSNLQNGNAPRNENPRLHGDFMWRMAYDLKSGGINTGYVAMFDEYDEGTAIAKIAENSSMIPTDQYFLTLDADGVDVSSDFYLRLTGDINRLFNNHIPLTIYHPTRTNLFPATIELAPIPFDPHSTDGLYTPLTLSNVLEQQALNGQIEIISPSQYQQKFVPIRFENLGFGQHKDIDIPFIMSDSVKFKISLDDGRSSIITIPVGQSIALNKAIADSSTAPLVELNRMDQYIDLGKPWGGSADLSALSQFKWDAANLYLSIAVKDNAHFQNWTSGDIWQGDSIQLGIDLSRNAGASSTNVNELGFALKNDGTITKWRWRAPAGMNPGAFTEADANITRDDVNGVTQYDITIPISSLHSSGATFNYEDPIGFSLLINENDGSGRAGFMEFNHGIGSSKDATLFGDLHLTDNDYNDILVNSAKFAVNKAKLIKDITSIDAAACFINLLQEGALKQSLTAVITALRNPISVPAGVSAVAVSDSSINITWTAVSRAASYNVYRSTSLNGAYTMANASSVETNSFTDIGLNAGATYYYKVTAVDAAGETDPSNTVSGTIRPIAPNGVSAATISASSINITWTAVSGAVSYNVYKSTLLNGSYAMVNSSVVGTNAYLDTGLSAGTTYYYKVTAVNAGGESVQSNAVFAITKLNAPTGLEADAKNTKIINLTWNKLTGASGYNVYRSLTANGIFVKVNTSTITENEYSNTNLNKGTTYYYKVTAVNAGGESVQSNLVSSTTKGRSNQDQEQNQD